MILRQRKTSRDIKQPPAAHPIHGQDPGVLPSGELPGVYLVLRPVVFVTAVTSNKVVLGRCIVGCTTSLQQHQQAPAILTIVPSLGTYAAE